LKSLNGDKDVTSGVRSGMIRLVALEVAISSFFIKPLREKMHQQPQLIRKENRKKRNTISVVSLLYHSDQFGMGMEVHIGKNRRTWRKGRIPWVPFING
jgi:hypothetical protein